MVMVRTVVAWHIWEWPLCTRPSSICRGYDADYHHCDIPRHCPKWERVLLCITRGESIHEIRLLFKKCFAFFAAIDWQESKVGGLVAVIFATVSRQESEVDGLVAVFFTTINWQASGLDGFVAVSFFFFFFFLATISWQKNEVDEFVAVFLATRDWQEIEVDRLVAVFCYHK